MLDRIREGLRHPALKQVRRVVIFVVGMTVLAIGALMLVLPGPGILVLIGGLALLAIEFAWARRWLGKARAMVDRATRKKSRAEPLR